MSVRKYIAHTYVAIPSLFIMFNGPFTIISHKSVINKKFEKLTVIDQFLASDF